MKSIGMMATGLVLSLLGTGCATKKYVAATVAPVEQRVSGTESKNTEQDKTLATHGTQIEELDRDLSKTRERLSDTDAKAAQAGEAAKAADQKAGNAQQAADGAHREAQGAREAADGARTFAEQGLNGLDHTIQSMNKFQIAKSESVLFDFNMDTLRDDAKAQLDAVGKQAKGLNRYMIEVQGFTDKSGTAAYNETLSERRARSVARYLVSQYQIPVRSISMLGVGYAQPVADDNTRDGRKMNRRVEVRLWVAESESPKTTASTSGAR